MGSIPITTFIIVFSFFFFLRNFNFKLFFVSLRYKLSFLVVYLDNLKIYNYYLNTQVSYYSTFSFFHLFFYYFINSDFIGTFAFNADKNIFILHSDKVYFNYSSAYFVYSTEKIKFFNFYNKHFIFLF